MKKEEVLKKVQNNEGLTVKEIILYQKIAKPIKHTYGKYGTLAKQYLEEHNLAKMWGLAGDLPEYLHGIDRQAEELYETMYEKLSGKDEYKKIGIFVVDLQRESEIQKRIEEEILTEIVYV